MVVFLTKREEAALIKMTTENIDLTLYAPDSA